MQVPTVLFRPTTGAQARRADGRLGSALHQDQGRVPGRACKSRT